MKFDIPINITAVATTEEKAERQVAEFLIKAFKEYANEFYITDFEYFDFGEAEDEDSNS